MGILTDYVTLALSLCEVMGSEPAFLESAGSVWHRKQEETVIFTIVAMRSKDLFNTQT